MRDALPDGGAGREGARRRAAHLLHRRHDRDPRAASRSSTGSTAPRTPTRCRSGSGPACTGAGPSSRGDDLIGHDVNVAARIVDVAAPGELLCSGPMLEAADADHDDQDGYVELGPVMMKGIPEPIDLFRVERAELDDPAPHRDRAARDAATRDGPPGYWPSRWPAEDGGPTRRQAPASGPGLGIRPGERLEVTARRDVAAATMVVLRDPGEAYLLRHTGGADAISLGRAHRPRVRSSRSTAPPTSPAGRPGPAGWPRTRNGSLYVVFGNHAHRLGAGHERARDAGRSRASARTTASSSCPTVTSSRRTSAASLPGGTDPRARADRAARPRTRAARDRRAARRCPSGRSRASRRTATTCTSSATSRCSACAGTAAPRARRPASHARYRTDRRARPTAGTRSSTRARRGSSTTARAASATRARSAARGSRPRRCTSCASTSRPARCS